MSLQIKTPILFVISFVGSTNDIQQLQWVSHQSTGKCGTQSSLSVVLLTAMFPPPQEASCTWGWCSEPSSGAAFRTKWAVNSVCSFPCPSTASSPSCPPSSKATAPSSSVAWCLALGELLSLSVRVLETLKGLFSAFMPPCLLKYTRRWTATHQPLLIPWSREGSKAKQSRKSKYLQK